MGLLGLLKSKPIRALLGVAAPVVIGVAVANDSEALLQLKKRFEGLDIFSSGDAAGSGKPGSAPNANRGLMCAAIKSECLKKGITPDDNMIKKIVDSTGEVFKKDFEQLTEAEKQLVADAFIQAKQRMIAMIDAGKILPTASEEELLKEFWKQFAIARDAGISEAEIDEMFSEVQEVFQAQIFENADTSGKIDYIEEQQQSYRAKYLEKFAEIKKLPKEQQEEAIEKLNEEFNAKAKISVAYVAATQDSEVAIHSVKLDRSSEVATNMQTILNTRATKAERTRTADLADFGFTKSMAKSYSLLGDPMSADSVEAYTTTIMEQKSTAGVTSYHEAYIDDRKAYEAAKAKQERGETLTKEDKDRIETGEVLYPATAKGIALGTSYNANMSEDEKAQFFAKMLCEAKQFSDYSTIANCINKILDANPTLKQKCAEYVGRYERQAQQEKAASDKSKTADVQGSDKADAKAKGQGVADKAQSEDSTTTSVKGDGAAVSRRNKTKAGTNVSVPDGMSAADTGSRRTSASHAATYITDTKDSNTSDDKTVVANIQADLDAPGAKFIDIYKKYSSNSKEILQIVLNDKSKYGKFWESAVNKLVAMVPEKQKEILSSLEQTTLAELYDKCPALDLAEILDESKLTHDYKYLVKDGEENV